MIGIIQFFLKLGQNEGIIEGVKNKKLTSQIDIKTFLVIKMIVRFAWTDIDVMVSCKSPPRRMKT
jgi:hypothetical protein